MAGVGKKGCASSSAWICSKVRVHDKDLISLYAVFRDLVLRVNEAESLAEKAMCIATSSQQCFEAHQAMAAYHQLYGFQEEGWDQVGAVLDILTNDHDQIPPGLDDTSKVSGDGEEWVPSFQGDSWETISEKDAGAVSFARDTQYSAKSGGDNDLAARIFSTVLGCVTSDKDIIGLQPEIRTKSTAEVTSFTCCSKASYPTRHRQSPDDDEVFDKLSLHTASSCDMFGHEQLGTQLEYAERIRCAVLNAESDDVVTSCSCLLGSWGFVLEEVNLSLFAQQSTIAIWNVRHTANSDQILDLLSGVLLEHNIVTTTTTTDFSVSHLCETEPKNGRR